MRGTCTPGWEPLYLGVLAEEVVVYQCTEITICGIGFAD